MYTALFNPSGTFSNLGLASINSLPLPQVRAQLDIFEFPAFPAPPSSTQGGYGRLSNRGTLLLSEDRAQATSWFEPFIADQLNSLGWTKVGR